MLEDKHNTTQVNDKHLYSDAVLRFYRSLFIGWVRLGSQRLEQNHEKGSHTNYKKQFKTVNLDTLYF